MTEFSTLYNRVERHAQGCSTLLMLSALRESAIELCERGRIWKFSESGIAMAKSTNTFTIFPPDGAEVINIKSVTYQDSVAKPVSEDWLDENYHGWRTEEGNMPKYYYLTMDGDGVTVNVIPKASENLTEGISCSSILRPTQDSTGFDDGLFARYRSGIIDGALREILSIKNKSWFDEDLAKKYEHKFEALIATAAADALRSFTSAPLSVKPVCFI